MYIYLSICNFHRNTNRTHYILLNIYTITYGNEYENVH